MDPFATLPMYDLAPLRPATAALWAALRDALREAGFVAPDALTPGAATHDGLVAQWLSPSLVLGQTCGRPYLADLRGRVTLIGAPDYGGDAGEGDNDDWDDDPPGHYHSVFVTRADDPRDTLEAFRGATFAANGRDSQSGWWAPIGHVGDGFFGAATITGAHLASARAVRGGRADIAAIDRVTWGLARRHTHETRGLRVVARTAPTPGLPLIAAAHHDATRLADAVERGLATLPPDVREALAIRGFVRLRPADYDVLDALTPSFRAAPAR